MVYVIVVVREKKLKINKGYMLAIYSTIYIYRKLSFFFWHTCKEVDILQPYLEPVWDSYYRKRTFGLFFFPLACLMISIRWLNKKRLGCTTNGRIILFFVCNRCTKQRCNVSETWISTVKLTRSMQLNKMFEDRGWGQVFPRLPTKEHALYSTLFLFLFFLHPWCVHLFFFPWDIPKSSL